MAHSSKCTHFLPYYLAILYRNKSALAFAKYRKPPADENVCPKGIILNKARPLSEKKNHPLMKFLDFPDVIPDEAQQAPIPRQSLVMRLQERGVTRVHHSLIISSLLLLLLLLGLGSA